MGWACVLSGRYCYRPDDWHYSDRGRMVAEGLAECTCPAGAGMCPAAPRRRGR